MPISDSLASTDALPACHALWIGSGLGPVDAACLASFVTQGHRVILHAYDTLEGVPAGVELRDAEQVLPRNRIVRFRRTGSPALFANIFRYELLRRGADLWIDTDLMCLKPIPRAPYIYGWEHDGRANNAVLALPPDSPGLASLIAFCDSRTIPPWLSRRTRLKLAVGQRLGYLRIPEDLRWGSLGPDAVTHFMQQSGEIAHAAPSDIYYPLDFSQFSRLFDPDLTIADITTARTRTVHLFATSLRLRKDAIPPSSPLGRMLAR